MREDLSTIKEYVRIHKETTIGLLILASSFGFLYYHVIHKLIRDWSIDDNYSHGFLIVPLALYFVWERRARLKAAAKQPSFWGVIVVLGSMASLLAGVLGSELFLTRISMLGTIAGCTLFLLGWKHLRLLIFPIAFLLLMIPVPAIIFNQIAFPLQLLASRFGETALMLFHIPALREGNVIHLTNTSLEVAEACSGIRSLISLLTLAVVYSYFTDSRFWARIILILGVVPIAVSANGIRVAGTGIAAYLFGAQTAQGFFHAFSGWIIFIAAFIMLFVLHRIVILMAPAKTSDPSNASRT
jgi:exosortase